LKAVRHSLAVQSRNRGLAVFLFLFVFFKQSAKEWCC
jgi:hypothetical protein